MNPEQQGNLGSDCVGGDLPGVNSDSLKSYLAQASGGDASKTALSVQHTPGPWRVVAREVLEDGSVYPGHIVGGPADLEVCPLEAASIANLAVNDKSGFWTREPSWKSANARLIAAAPDLLEALTLLEQEMVLSGNAGSKDYGWKPAIEKTRAAIAKATGSRA